MSKLDKAIEELKALEVHYEEGKQRAARARKMLEGVRNPPTSPSGAKKALTSADKNHLTSTFRKNLLKPTTQKNAPL